MTAHKGFFSPKISLDYAPIYFAIVFKKKNLEESKMIDRDRIKNKLKTNINEFKTNLKRI